MKRQFGQRAGYPAPNAGRKYPAEPLTPAEVGAIIGKCSGRAPTGIRNRALLTLLYRSGLRVSEVLAVRPSDVDMARHSIRLLDTKSGRAQTRGFHPSADDALARWMDTRKALRTGPGRLFCTLAGGPLSDDYVRGLLRRLGAKAGVGKRVHPHGLRHTFAVELEAAGTPVTVISKLLGHSSVAVTARYLDHLTNGQAVSALAGADLPPLAGGSLAAAEVLAALTPQSLAGDVPGAMMSPRPAPAQPDPVSEPQAAGARPPRLPGTARPREEPKITTAAEYQIVKAADYAESGTWQVMVGGTRAGWIRRTWQDTGTRAAWQATDTGNMPVKCAGEGATPRGNARTRDKAARELLYSLMQRQERARLQARQDRQRGR